MGEGRGEGLSAGPPFDLVLRWVTRRITNSYFALCFAPYPNPSQREGTDLFPTLVVSQLFSLGYLI